MSELKDDLVERLRERADHIRGYIKSSQLVVDLLQPETDKFEARTGHDLYTVRMAVDHQSSIRTQTKELEELDQAADRIEAQAKLIEGLREGLEIIAHVARSPVTMQQTASTLLTSIKEPTSADNI